MLFTRAEMEILRLCAWCKELPTRKSENLPAETIDELVWCGLLRVSRNKSSHRLTPCGYETLQKAGFEHSMDNAYRTEEHIVSRRHQGAEIALFFNRFGADVFVDAPRAEICKDFYVSAYTSPLTLNLIRENDTIKTKNVFKEYCQDWTDEQWIAIENIVSGIEFATIMTNESRTPLDIQIKKALKTILTIYNVPKEKINEKLEKVLNMDYRALGRRILIEFKEYINLINDNKLKN